MKKEASELLELDEVLTMKGKEVRSYFKEYLNPGLAHMLSLLDFDKRYVKAKGVEVWDEDGNRYLDFLGGYGSLSLGHNPDEIIEALQKASSLPNFMPASYPIASCFAYNLSCIAPGELKTAFVCNSGAEAVEGAVKLARAASGKKKIIYCEGAFHGKTMGALSVTGREKYQKPFEPLLPECYSIPYGDSDYLEKMLKNKDVAAFIVEPIQGEGGVIIPPEGYLKEVQELCSKYDALLIMDEVQTGLGRTGKMFACDWEGIEPDIMCMAKSLGGSIMPVGAYITKPEHFKRAYGTFESCLLHTSTFGGNSWACAAGIEAINQIVKKNLPEKALEKGEYLQGKLSELKESHKLIKEVRGKGLLIGLHFEENSGMLNKFTRGYIDKLSKEFMGSLVAAELINKHNIITAYTFNNPNVIRLAPPLIIEQAQLDEVIDAMEEIMRTKNSFLKMALSSSKTAFKSIIKR